MATVEIEQRWIDKFQDNLGIIRKVAGWTTQELADEIGVARQTVSNLETGKTPMTKLQYLALRTVFNAEIARCNNLDLAKVIKTWWTIPSVTTLRFPKRLLTISHNIRCKDVVFPYLKIMPTWVIRVPAISGIIPRQGAL